VRPESDDEEIKRPQNRILRMRSFGAVGPKLQAIIQVAQKYVSDYTLFTNPFLTALDILHLVDEAWEFAQDSQQKYEEINKDSKALVSEVELRCVW